MYCGLFAAWAMCPQIEQNDFHYYFNVVECGCVKERERVERGEKEEREGKRKRRREGGSENDLQIR